MVNFDLNITYRQMCPLLKFLVYHVTFEWDFVFYQTWNPIWCSNNVRLGDSEGWVSCQISPSY